MNTSRFPSPLILVACIFALLCPSLHAADSKTALPRLVDLGAGKCIPCKQMKPVLEDLTKTYAGQLEVVFIDVWENPDAGTQHRVRMIPTQIFYNAEGKELARHESFMSKKDILAKWKSLGVSLAAPASTQETNSSN